MKTHPLRTLLTVLVLSVSAVLAPSAFGQDYPNRPVKIVVPYGPGTAIDVIVRHLAETMSKQLNQTFLVENRAGASGTIATAYAAQSPPDGYTILSDASTHNSAPAFMGKLPYDAVRDFAGITTITQSPLVLVVAKSSGFKSLGELIAAAKAKPGDLTFASAGVGSSTHMTGAKLNYAAGVNILHVPFKSTTDALTEVVAGRVTYTYTGVASALPLVKDGRLVALSMGGSKRTTALPDVPTSEEAGIANSAYPGWLGLMVPVKTPRAIVNRLHGEVVKALNSADMKEKIAKAGTEVWTMSPEEFDANSRREILDNEKLVKELGLKMP